MSESKPGQVSVLLVEDETLIRMMIADVVEGLGHTVAAEAANIVEASALAQTANFEIAILDINVGGDRIDPVAEIIAGRRLPFIFASGYGAAGSPEKFRHMPILQKPFHRDGDEDETETSRRRRRDFASTRYGPEVNRFLGSWAAIFKMTHYPRPISWRLAPSLSVA